MLCWLCTRRITSVDAVNVKLEQLSFHPFTYCLALWISDQYIAVFPLFIHYVITCFSSLLIGNDWKLSNMCSIMDARGFSVLADVSSNHSVVGSGCNRILSAGVRDYFCWSSSFLWKCCEPTRSWGMSLGMRGCMNKFSWLTSSYRVILLSICLIWVFWNQVVCWY